MKVFNLAAKFMITYLYYNASNVRSIIITVENVKMLLSVDSALVTTRLEVVVKSPIFIFKLFV